MGIEIHGFCDERFAPMRTAFATNFEKDLEIGASLAMTYRGKTVLDLWAGHTDPERTRPWQQDTIAIVSSTTKIPITIALLMVVDRGLIELDRTVAHYWPDFAQSGKGAVTVRDVLTHQAGVPGLDPPSTFEVLCDWGAVTARIAAEPHWFGGERRTCYHSHTFGFLAGELIRRVDGRKPRQFLREEITDKIGADFQIGLVDEAELRRVANVQWPAHPAFEGIRAKVFSSFPQPRLNDWAWLSLEYPGAIGLGNGRSIARLCAIMAMGGELDGARFLSRELARQAGQPQATGVDPLFGPITWGLGFALDNDAYRAPSPASMHWGGLGGSWALVDPRAQVSLGYAPNNWRFDENEMYDRRLARFGRVLHELLPSL